MCPCHDCKGFYFTSVDSCYAHCDEYKDFITTLGDDADV